MPSSRPLRVLLLEDSASDAALLDLELVRAGFRPDITRVESEASFRDALHGQSWDVLIADYNLPSFSGLEALSIYNASELDMPFFLVSGTVGEERAVQAMRSGAHDYLLKDSLARLGPAVARELREAELRRARKADLERLVASERRFTSIYQNSPVAIVVASLADGLIYDLNPAALELFGLPRDAIVGRRAAAFGAWPDTPHATDTFERDRVFERTLRRDGGESITALASFSIIELDGALRLVVTLQNISDRKRAEDTLRESEERFRTLVENSNDLIAELTRAGEILYASPNHAALTGYSTAELCQRNLLEFVHPDDAAEVATMLAGGRPFGQFRFRFSDGSYHFLEASVRSFQLGEQAARSVVIARDVSDRVLAQAKQRELEEQLRNAQRLDALGTLAGGIAHDFNNILSAIVAYTEMIHADAHQPASVREHAAELAKAQRRAADLVKQILSFSRQHKLTREPTSPVQIVRDALKLLRSTLPANIEISADLHADDLLVLADSSQIHQVMMNLGTNAAHAIGEAPGKINVSLAPSELSMERGAALGGLAQGRYAHLCVEDSGHGMSQAVLERIFEPFFTTKPPGAGTGLGLAVVHGIVRDHEGAITVKSQVGVGTRVDVYLPEHRAVTRTEAAASDDAPPGSGERVLFVDDEVQLCRSARLLLDRLGYRTSAFSDPTEALEQFTRAPWDFDVLLTDLTMPRLNGVELARRVLALRPDLPVVLLSGFSDERTAERASALGIREVLEKPASLQGLATAIRRALRPQAVDAGPVPRRSSQG